MPRKIFFKEVSSLPKAPAGYSTFGFNQEGNAFSVDETGTSSSVNYIEPPRNYYLTKQNNILNQPQAHLVGSFTGKDSPKRSQYQHLDVNLSSSNLFGIFIEEDVKSLQLPVKYKESLSRLVLWSAHNQNETIEIRLSDYPNLDWLVLRETWSNSNLGQPSKIRPNYLITDTVLDFPKSGALWLADSLGFSTETSINLQATSLEIRPYHNQWISVAAKSLQNVDINFGSMSYGDYDPDTEATRYVSVINLFNCPNLTGITFSNLNFTSLSSTSEFVFNFYASNFGQSDVDYVLQTLDNYFTQSTTSYLIIGAISGGDEPSVTTQGELVEGIYTGFVVGQNYIIDEVQSGDDFSNIGFTTTGVEFTATDTTPTNWSNSTRVFYGSSFGNMKNVDFVSASFSIPDGHYLVPIGSVSFGMTFSGGSLVQKELLNHNIRASLLDFVGKQYQLTGDIFVKYNENGNIIYSGKNADIVTFEVSEIFRNSPPTDGTSNTNYLSLISKGWEVKIAKA